MGVMVDISLGHHAPRDSIRWFRDRQADSGHADREDSHFRLDFDCLPAAALALNLPQVTRLRPLQHTLGEAGTGLRYDEGDDARFVLFEHPGERLPHAIDRRADRLALGRTDGLGMFLQLAIDFRLALFHFFNTLAMPQAGIKVLQLVEPTGFQAVIASNRRGGLLGRCGGTSV
jgi:hypothetical protein